MIRGTKNQGGKKIAIIVSMNELMKGEMARRTAGQPKMTVVRLVKGNTSVGLPKKKGETLKMKDGR
jgi:hypothetical protein